ncbi:MAG: DNA starvation/stationary phase protection protein [Actinomycetaceae bacterium]|nr:DNA starvation/stationary phase protection protein [Actinomycetaceae bacterium]
MPKINDTVATGLQQALVDLISLELQGKQAHWNIKGDRFRALHLALDEVVDVARRHSDEVAERIATLGGTPDGREETIAKTSTLEAMDAGVLSVDKTYGLMADKIQQVCDKAREYLEGVDEADPISGDLLIGMIGELEQQAWFLRAATE